MSFVINLVEITNFSSANHRRPASQRLQLAGVLHRPISMVGQRASILFFALGYLSFLSVPLSQTSDVTNLLTLSLCRMATTRHSLEVTSTSLRTSSAICDSQAASLFTQVLITLTTSSSTTSTGRPAAPFVRSRRRILQPTCQADASLRWL